MIKWNNKAQDGYVEGLTPFGKVYIKLDREDKVTGMYTVFGSTKKYIPKDEWMEDLVGAQLYLETITNKVIK